MAEPLVWIVLLNFQNWQETLSCLDSLKNLEYTNHHIVVVDNASPNDSVKQLRQAVPDLHLIESTKNLGFGGGCNLGIRAALEAQAEYIWLLNTDTRVDPKALEALVETAERDPRVGGVGSVIYDFEPPDQIQAWGGGKVNLWIGRSWPLRTPGLPDYLTGASLLLRAEALREVGLFDESFFFYWEDTDLSFRLKRAGWRLIVAKNSIVWHKGGASLGGWGNNPSFDFYYNASRVRFMKRWSPFPPLAILIGVTGFAVLRYKKPKFALTALRGGWSGLFQ
jgi:GT2 family glycosyltransferase